MLAALAHSRPSYRCHAIHASSRLPPCHPAPPEGKPIPTELRKEEAELRHKVELEDDNTAVPRTHVDDEYARAAERDPKILITTSRDPSSRLVQFAKELKLVFPNSQRVNRGGQVLEARWVQRAPASTSMQGHAMCSLCLALTDGLHPRLPRLCRLSASWWRAAAAMTIPTW